MMMLNLAGYQTTDQLYAGTRTEVYRAIRVADQQPVIIKVLRNPHPNFNELVQFRNQYIITKHLSHPNIVQPLALERYGNGYALIMPDQGAIALKDYWQQSDHSLSKFLNIAIQLAEALHYLNQQRIIHKDIKPGNILICPETHQVELIDFSISTVLSLEEQQLISPNVLEGTLAYISPEQTGRMNRGIDYRTDFYSLGVTFYELLTGKLPFTSDDPMELVHCHIAKMPILGNGERGTGNREDIPHILSDIVLKLMAKNAEDRYQSALGLKHDLEQCLHQLETTGEITEFEIAQRDICDRFTIPEKLYGREAEVAQLLAAFNRIANPPLKEDTETGRHGDTERASHRVPASPRPRVSMMLVAGFSGVGKTAVVNEVHKPIVEKRGYFIQGKFDQFNRNIPFSAFVQAFRDLMGQLLGESDAEITNWKNNILNALGSQGQVIIDVIPELEKIIGQQPAVPELSGSAAQNRFNLLLSQLIRVFTTPEHPLVIFLDDLQWADSASLNLLKVLMSDSDASYLLVLGAYRDNEVFPAHPLILTLDELKKQTDNIHTLTLAPLRAEDLTQLVADTLRCSLEIAAPLSELIYQKTQGNPFFTTQFLKGLHEDGWIKFDANAGYWQCDLTPVRELALTDDVVKFTIGRLRKLPQISQDMLKFAACIGNQFDLETLAIVCDRSLEEVATDLWAGLQEGFVVPTSETYKFFHAPDTQTKEIENIAVTYRFLHDRVQQAAYALIPEDLKQATHLKIGQQLLNKIPPVEQKERIFEIVNQLNYSLELIQESPQLIQLAQLNLTAGQKAKNATAYRAAKNYFSIAQELLGSDSWESDYPLTLQVYTAATEVAYLNGDFQEMDRFAQVVLCQGKTLLDRLEVYETKIVALIVQNQQLEAVKTALAILQQLNIELPEQPTELDFTQGLESVTTNLQGRPIGELVNLPLMSDRNIQAGMRILASIFSAAYVAIPSLVPLIAFKMVNLSLQYGNAPDSPFGYSLHGLILCGALGDIQSGYEYGRLARAVLERGQGKALRAKVGEIFATFIQHWQEPLQSTLPLLMESYQHGLEEGDLEFAGYSLSNYAYHSLWLGKSLKDLSQEFSTHNQALGKIQQNVAQTHHKIHWQTILNLIGELGESDNPQILVGAVYNETEMFQWHQEKKDLTGLAFLSLCQMFLRYLFGHDEKAAQFADTCAEYLPALIGSSCIAVFHFYDSLVQLATLESEVDQPDSQRLERVEANQAKMAKWATHAPMNHQHKFDLVEAEKYRILGKPYQAGDFYDRAIAGAKEHGFLSEEALANELAAKFYLNWGKEKIAAVYLTDAYYAYARWGAGAKTDQLETKYPQLLAPILEPKFEVNAVKGLDILTQTVSSTQHTNSSSEFSHTLDFLSLLQADRVLSSTLELNPLLDEISRIILINAGAQKAVLIVPQDDQWQLRTIAHLTSDGTLETNMNPQPLTVESPVPIRLIHYVKNTQKPVLINEGKTEITGILEGYLLKYKPASVLCFPLVNQSELEAIVYLEHPTTKGIFTPHRQTLVQFLCTEAAISLKNAHLYQQAQQALLDLQQAQLQLVQSEKMSALGNLMAGVAHEINNPTGFLKGNIQPAQDYLQDLLGLIDLYQKQFPNPGEAIESEIEAIDLEFIREDFPDLLASMNQGIERIKSISTSLRTFARKDEEKKVAFKLHEGIDSTLLILKHRTKANEHRPKIKIVKDYGEIPEVQCFPGQLNQVFMNILANAIDAFDEANVGKSYAEIKQNPNRIEISTSQLDETRVQIQIKDNGCGMKPETQARIFEQGFTTKGVGKGTGLGMAIAHQIVTEKHGGTITCTSELGKGTEFAIVLPISG